MERLCERPGCSESASVSYGMRPEDLVFWLDGLADAAAAEHGVLCQRCADSMVVPRGWTLDDLRDPELHLFRPPADPTGSTSRRRQARPVAADGHRQLVLGVDEPATESPAPGDSTGPAEPLEPVAADTDDDAPTPWMPVFDTDDDLDGLLSARSPLLSRAFRGVRPS